jgi:endonuclease YncB( thermonuclease family)
MRGWWLSFCFLLLASPAEPCAADDATFTVTQVTGATSFMLDNGETVRLQGIEIPGGTYRDTAKATLVALAEHQTIRLVFDAKNHDRYGRIPAQAYRADGTWLQAALLKDGLAMVSPHSLADDVKTTEMLAIEHSAQAAKRGLWADEAWRVISPEETEQYINRFKIVEGRITSANTWHDAIYINFSDRWKGHFNLYIGRKYAERFDLARLQAMTGKRVRVRGWIRDHHGPTMDITQPSQIETE